MPWLKWCECEKCKMTWVPGNTMAYRFCYDCGFDVFDSQYKHPDGHNLCDVCGIALEERNKK